MTNACFRDNARFVSILILAIMAVLSVNAAETIGVWVFNGTAGQACSGTIPNLVENAPDDIEMISGKMTDDSPAAVYSDDLPLTAPDGLGLSLYDSRKQGIKYANVTSSLHLESQGNNQNTTLSPYVRAKGIGKYLANSDYTIEIIYRGTNYMKRGSNGPQNRFVMGVGDGTEETSVKWWMSEYNNGRMYGATKDMATTGWQNLSGVKSVGWQVFNMDWYSVVYKYSATDHKLTVSTVNNHTDKTSASFSWDATDVPVLSDDGFFQVMGYCGILTAAFTRVDLVAVRISKGLVESGDYLSLGQDYDANPLLAHWRFDGTKGAAYASDVNIRPAAAFADVDRGQIRCHGGTSAIYADASKLFVRDGVNGGLVTNGSSAGNASGLQLTGDNFYPLCTANEFTFEAFVRVDVQPTADAVVLFGTGNSYDHWSQSWSLRLGKSNLKPTLVFNDTDATGAKLDGVITKDSDIAIELGKWFHLAVVYDTQKTLKLYVNRQVAISYTVGSDRFLQKTDNGYLFAPGYYQTNVGAGRLVGAFDEFRITAKALAPDEFLRQSNNQGLILVVQ